MSDLETIVATAAEVEAYAEAHLFDGAGLMMSGIDRLTGRPFDRDFITEEKVPRRAMFDPWSYWTYEDSIMSAGHYIDGLVLRYEYSGDATALDRAKRVWRACLAVSYQSQVYGGLGCFLRPYGGFDQMEKFGEPLGTDQAAPLFSGAYRLLKYLDTSERAEAVRLLLGLIRWYADQGYAYRYYKCIQHHWRPPGHHHASSFYLPAIAFAAREAGERRWKDDLDRYLHRQLNDPEILTSEPGLAWNFKQGGLLILRDILGERFGEHFTPGVLRRLREDVARWLRAYDGPGMTRRVHPESAAPGFAPYMRPGFRRDRDMGYPHTAWVHGGRTRPRHELTILTTLAALGEKEAGPEAARLFALRRRVPDDFTHYLAEDYDILPPAAHLHARAVGAVMMDWWCNAWVLIRAMDSKGKGT